MSVITGLGPYYSLQSNVQSANDSSHLTDHNTITFAAGKVSNGASFVAASSQYASIAAGGGSPLLFGNEDATFAGWIKFTTVSVVFDFLSNWDVSNQQSYLLRMNGGTNQIQFLISDTGANDTTITHSTTVTTGTWYFVAARYDATNNLMRLRVDSTDETPVSQTAGFFSSTSDFALGAINPSSPTNFLNGMMDEWGIWHAHKTDAELDWLFNSGNGRSYSDIVAEAGGGGGTPFFTRIDAQRIR